jgi:hypothetical protein
MDIPKQVDFTVDGYGTFTVLTEPPKPKMFYDERTELAKLVGGRVELLQMESMLGRYSASSDPAEKDLAERIKYELGTANILIDFKNRLVKAPDGFTLDGITRPEFDKVWLAMETALSTFRPKPASAPAVDTQSSKATG